MAEEDILWGKKRHLFGGIEPSNMRKFTVRAYTDYGIEIEAQLPNDTVVEGQNLCTVAGAVIRKKLNDYPTDEFDGEAVLNITESGLFTDPNPDFTNVYYYAAFPYTTHGVYNRSTSNRVMLDPTVEVWLFGYDLDTNDPDPDTRVTYPIEVDNYDWIPVSLAMADRIFSYGDWTFEPGEYFMPRPCMLGYDGKVLCYLNPNNYTYDVDGEYSRITSTGAAGNAMVEWPKIYTYREEVNGIYKFRCSNRPHGVGWDCWCNYDKYDNEIEHFYTSIYSASLVSGGTTLRSISGGTLATCDLKTAIEYANNNGDDWTLETAADRLLINDLLVMMAKSTDSQTAYGQGKIFSGAGSVASGHSNTYGMFYGGNSSYPVKTFGMEDLWGNITRRCVGWICEDGIQKIKMTRGTHDGSTVSDYNATGSGYIEVEGVNVLGTVRYCRNMRCTPFGRIPIIEDAAYLNGSASQYECDIVYFVSTLSSPALGEYYNGTTSYAGCFAVRFIDVSSNSSIYGYGLSCKPSAK